MSLVHRQAERSYQRGLLLGFTMAEVITLVVFVLMLALSAMLVKQHEANAAIEKARDELAASLAAIIGKVEGGSASEKDIEDIFKELKLAREHQQELMKLKSELAEARKAQDSLEQIASAIDVDKSYPSERKMDEILTKVRMVVQTQDAWRLIDERVASQKVDLPQSQPERQVAVKNYTMSALDFHRDFLHKARDVGLKPEDIEVAIDHLEATRREQERTIANQRAQIANLSERLGGGGKGTEKPPCWASESGKIEYIFDVTLTSAGLILKDNALRHRTEEQAALPIEAIRFNEPLSANEFRSQTRALFNWSNSRECRFFVRVYDGTGASEKSVYKRMLRTAGEHFYYFDVSN